MYVMLYFHIIASEAAGTASSNIIRIHDDLSFVPIPFGSQCLPSRNSFRAYVYIESEANDICLR